MASGQIRELWRRAISWPVYPGFTRRWGSLLYLGGPKSSPKLDLATAQRLTVIRFDGMGDLVAITGFLRELRSSAPKARISLVIRGEWEPLMRTCPYVDEVVPFVLSSYRRFAPLHWHRDLWQFARRELWPRRPECVVVPQTSFSFFEIRTLAFWSRSPRRVGWSEYGQGSGGSRPVGEQLLNVVMPMDIAEHEADKCYRLLEWMGGRVADRRLELWPAAEEKIEARSRATSLRPAGGKLIALGIGASQAGRIWPIERFMELCRAVTEFHSARFVTLGGQDCAGPGGLFAAALNGLGVNLAGQLTLRETAAFLGECDLFIGNDSGPMHLAAAAGCPVIEISGWPGGAPRSDAASPWRMGPYCQRRVIVQPSGNGEPWHLQIEQVSVEQVMKGALSLLGPGNER